MENNRDWWEGKVCLVTGGSRGIGAAVAQKVALSGAAVAINYLKSEDQAAGLVRTIRESGGRALAVQTDIRQEAAVDRMFTRIENTLGAVDLLVNNAGISLQKMLIDTSAEEWQAIMDTNLSGPFYCCRRALPAMMEKRCGRIVNVASIWGLRGAGCEAVYAAAKGGLIALSRSLAVEAGAWGITVNALAPGPVETDMLLSDLAVDERRELAGEIPLGRLGRSEEIASACRFLLSAEAAYINGSVLVLDGGWKS